MTLFYLATSLRRSALALTAVAGSLGAQTLLFPPAAAAGDLPSFSAVPFGATSAEVVQFVIDSSAWAVVNDPIEITQLRFRADGAVAGTWGGVSIQQLDVRLSHGDVDVTTATAVMADNHGEDVLTAFTGSQAVGPVTTSGTGPAPFYATVNLTTPFVYHPAWGRNLVFELDSSGLNALSARMDAEETVPGVARIHSGQVRDTAVAVEFGYVTSTQMIAAFDVNVTTGASPLAVQFTDRSWSPHPAGITAWSWDFDNDGTVDSTVQSPSFTYTGCGAFSPTLTVVDATQAVTRTRPGLIVLNPLKAAFTVSPRMASSGPHMVTFTDTSPGVPTSWAWDFDGDGTYDSTLQSPTHAFGPGYHDVTLTVSNACVTDTVTEIGAVAVNPEITVPYFGNNGINPPGGVFFDVSVINPSGLHVSAMDLHIRNDAGTVFDLEVLITSGSHVGNDGNPAVWRPVSTATGVVSRGLFTYTFADVDDFYLPPGDYGVALYLTGASHRYTFQAMMPASQVIGNGDLVLTLGASRDDRFAGQRFDNRIWNGSIYYEPAPDGVYNTFGVGCANSQGETPTLIRVPGSELRIGQTFTARVGNMQPTQPIAVLILGFNNLFSGPGGSPLPLPLGPFGFSADCFLRVEALDTYLLFAAGGNADWAAPVPASAVLVGQSLFNQAFIVDPLAGTSINGVMSDAGGGVIGQ